VGDWGKGGREEGVEGGAEGRRCGEGEGKRGGVGRKRGVWGGAGKFSTYSIVGSAI